MRADVNVSVRKRGETGFRPRWELKNMNSFTFIRRGIDAAVREQVAAYERGETLEQSTYDYDPDTDRLTVHRSKEEADDYRYFPEPDLVPIEPPAELVERLRAELGELPGSRIRRIEAEVGYDLAYELVATGNEPKAVALVEHGVDWRAAANVAMNQPDFLLENADALAKILQANVTRDALNAAFAAAGTGRIDADEYLGQTAVSDESALGPAIDAVLAANPQQVETYRGGKEGVLGFLVGQVMKETGGKADPKVVNRLLREKLQA
jgi:aspartyl-tRNA(Asn)/glutamyl-tRNA(Gln) amidotransferase subunit B